MNTMMVRCATCGIPIRWLPTVVDGQAYCCLGCAESGPCECDYERLPQDGERTAMIHLPFLKQARGASNYG